MSRIQRPPGQRRPFDAPSWAEVVGEASGPTRGDGRTVRLVTGGMKQPNHGMQPTALRAAADAERRWVSNIAVAHT
ncbi:MAG: hypothetical protein IPG76_04240 [Acidobacteria bacterium]|nr:hypothetical protein [Acidobacteriota bacterium]